MLILELAHELLAEVGFAELAALYVDNRVVDQVEQNHKKGVWESRIQFQIEIGNSHLFKD